MEESNNCFGLIREAGFPIGFKLVYLFFASGVEDREMYKMFLAELLVGPRDGNGDGLVRFS